MILDLFRDTEGNYVSQLESFTDQKVSLFIDGTNNCSLVSKGMPCRKTINDIIKNVVHVTDFMSGFTCNEFNTFSIKHNNNWIKVSVCFNN